MIRKMAALDFENEVFASFAFYAGLMIMKMVVMSGLTAFRRVSSGTFSNMEDVKYFHKDKDAKPILNNEAVERVRRNHLNDVENIPAFVLLGFFYVLGGPSVFIANMHFRIFACARILHTIAYQMALPQPSRGLAFTASVLVLMSMGVQVIMSAI